MNTPLYDELEGLLRQSSEGSQIFSGYCPGNLMPAKTANNHCSFYPHQEPYYPFNEDTPNFYLGETPLDEANPIKCEAINTIPNMDFIPEVYDDQNMFSNVPCSESEWLLLGPKNFHQEEGGQEQSFSREREDSYSFREKIECPEVTKHETISFECQQTLGCVQKPIEKRSKNFTSLAVRNLKSNFGTGLIQFLEFQRDLAEFKKDEKETQICRRLLNFLRSRLNSFVSFDGWKDLLKDKEYGKALRKKAKEFFGKSFARTYVQFGKIREEYKPIYHRKIKCFFEGCKNPELLNPSTFNKY